MTAETVRIYQSGYRGARCALCGKLITQLPAICADSRCGRSAASAVKHPLLQPERATSNLFEPARILHF